MGHLIGKCVVAVGHLELAFGDGKLGHRHLSAQPPGVVAAAHEHVALRPRHHGAGLAACTHSPHIVAVPEHQAGSRTHPCHQRSRIVPVGRHSRLVATALHGECAAMHNACQCSHIVGAVHLAAASQEEVGHAGAIGHMGKECHLRLSRERQTVDGVTSSRKASREGSLCGADGSEERVQLRHVEVAEQLCPRACLTACHQAAETAHIPWAGYLIHPVTLLQRPVIELVVHPRHAALHIVAHHIHLGIPRAPHPRVAVEQLGEVWPAQEIEPLALPDECAQRIDIRSHPLGSEERVAPELRPDELQLCQGIGVREHPAHQHAPLPRLPHLIGPLLTLVAGIDRTVVVEREVVVPHGASVDEAVGPLLVHEHLPQHVGIAIVLAGQKIAQEGIEVEHAPVAAVPVGIVRSEHAVFHRIEVIADIVVLAGLYILLVGVVHRDGIAVARGEVDRVLRCIAVHLQQVTACDAHRIGAGIVHLGYVDAVLVQPHIVCELVATAIVAIEDDIHAAAPGREGHAHPAAHFVGHIVAYEGLVAIVVDEGPLLGLGRRLVPCRAVQHMMAPAVVELDAVRLVLMRGRVVAAHTRQYGILLDERSALIGDGDA